MEFKNRDRRPQIPSWLSRIEDPQKRAAYMKSLELEITNAALEIQRGYPASNFLPPAEAPKDPMDAYREALLSPSERAARRRGWRS